MLTAIVGNTVIKFDGIGGSVRAAAYQRRVLDSVVTKETCETETFQRFNTHFFRFIRS